MSGSRSLWARIVEAIRAANLRVTFDEERDSTRPCWICLDRSARSRHLVQVGSYLNKFHDDMTRPLCLRCKAAIERDTAPAGRIAEP